MHPTCCSILGLPDLISNAVYMEGKIVKPFAVNKLSICTLRKHVTGMELYLHWLLKSALYGNHQASLISISETAIAVEKVANWASELVWRLWRKDKTLTLSGIKRRLHRLGGYSLVNTQAGVADSRVQGSALAHWDFDSTLLNPKTKYVQKLIKQ